ncbi:MAG: hypothetical protein WC360_02890 [Opitutales bacterium]|jgi:hypothetical protein
MKKNPLYDRRRRIEKLMMPFMWVWFVYLLVLMVWAAGEYYYDWNLASIMILPSFIPLIIFLPFGIPRSRRAYVEMVQQDTGLDFVRRDGSIYSSDGVDVCALKKEYARMFGNFSRLIRKEVDTAFASIADQAEATEAEIDTEAYREHMRQAVETMQKEWKHLLRLKPGKA